MSPPLFHDLPYHYGYVSSISEPYCLRPAPPFSKTPNGGTPIVSTLLPSLYGCSIVLAHPCAWTTPILVLLSYCADALLFSLSMS